jgi:hypothetical protein
MPTFTPGQLNTGVDTTSLTGAITAQFQNPSGSAYFFLVQNTNKNADESYNIGITDYAKGSFSNLIGLSDTAIVQSNFKFGVAIPPGSSSMVFTPTDTSGGGNIKLKGTGNFTLII